MNIKYDALLGQVRADDSYDDGQTTAKLESVEQRVEALENTETDVPVEDVVYVADYDALQEIAEPQETVLYITEDTGLLYMYRNGSFEVIEGHQQGNTIFFSGEFSGLSELLKTYTDSSTYNVVLVQGSGVMATYRFVVNNSNAKVMQTLCKDQRDGTSANVRTRTGKNYNAQTGTWTWTGWKLRTPVYKEELDSSLIPGSANAVTGGAVATALIQGLNQLQHAELIDCTFRVVDIDNTSRVTYIFSGDTDIRDLEVGTYRVRIHLQLSDGSEAGGTSGLLFITGGMPVILLFNPSNAEMYLVVKPNDNDSDVWFIGPIVELLGEYFAGRDHSHNYSEIVDAPDLSGYATKEDIPAAYDDTEIRSLIDDHESSISGHETRISALEESSSKSVWKCDTVEFDSNGNVTTWPEEWDSWNVLDNKDMSPFVGVVPICIAEPSSGGSIEPYKTGQLILSDSLIIQSQHIKYATDIAGNTYKVYRRMYQALGNPKWTAWELQNS